MPSRNLIAALCLLLLLVFTSGLIKHGERQTRKGAISGRITEQLTARPVVSAVVRVPGESATTTDSDGAFLLEVPPGQKHLTIEHPDYESGNESVEVSAGDTVQMEIMLSDGLLFLDETVTNVNRDRVNVAEAAVEVPRAGSATASVPIFYDPRELLDKI